MAVVASARKRWVLVGVVGAAAVLTTASLAGAHGGQADKVHGCVVQSSGYLRIIGPHESCKKGELALDWSTSLSPAPGSIDTEHLADGAVTTAKIAEGTILGADVNDETITSADLGAASVASEEILNGAVTAVDLASDAVVGRAGDAASVNIRQGTIRGEGAAVAGVVTGDIALGTIGHGNLADGAVDATKLSASFLGELVTETELAGLTGLLKGDDANSLKRPNDLDGFVHWNNLEGMPEGFSDGFDDDGSGKVQQLENTLAEDDGTPNENTGSNSDAVSFSNIKDLTTAVGGGFDGRITGDFIKDGTIRAVDLAGSDSQTDPVAGAVTSEKILDGTVSVQDLAAGSVTVAKLGADVILRFEALERRLADLASAPAGGDQDRVSTTRLTGNTLATSTLDPAPVGPMTRSAQLIPVDGLRVGDMVTVSPPPSLHDDLLFVGHDVVADGRVTVYLYNNSPQMIDDDPRRWKIQYLDLTP